MGRLSERIKPSPEQSAAQKGVPRCEQLLQTLFKNVKPKGPVLLVQWTGYVEEFGSAVLRLSTKVIPVLKPHN